MILFGKRNPDCLKDARRIVAGQRQADYGSPSENMRRIALAWSAVLGLRVEPRQVPLMLAVLKLVREGNRHKRDNLIDAAGYVRIAEMVENGEV